MSPKRRYQSSSFGIGLPPPPLPPPEYFSNFTYAYNRPLTATEKAVNPCVASKKITTTGASAPCVGTSSTKKGSKPTATPVVEEQGGSKSKASGRSYSSKGNKTYRVKHHHQNHYELPTGGAGSSGGDPTRPPSASLSHGLFGLPSMHDYFHLQDHLEESISDQHPPPPVLPKPRMKSTLPSFKSGLVQHPPHQPQEEDMEGILQVRPASRSRTRPEYLGSGGGGTKRPPVTPGARRRVQSVHQLKPSSAETAPPPPPVDSLPPKQRLGLVLSPDILESLLTKLRSQDSNWEEIVEGFYCIQEYSKDAPSQIKPILRKVIWAGLPHLSTSRTKLSRAACQCFKSLYESQRRSMEGEGDKVFQRLLDLCGGPSNKFIQEECKVALLAAIQHTDPLKCLHLIEQHGCRHKNPHVRECAAVLLAKLMELVPVDRLMSKEYASRIFPMIVGFLREGQLNTRMSGKTCLGRIFSHPDFNMKLRRHVTPENLRHVQDILKKFQPSGHSPTYSRRPLLKSACT